MTRPECTPYQVAILAIEKIKAINDAEFDLVLTKLRNEQAECERGGGTPPPDGVISGGLPPTEELDGEPNVIGGLMPEGDEGP